MAAIPPEYLDLFTKKALACLATLMPDGSPQVTPVWVDYDGEHILVNTAVGRQKDRNMQRDQRVALAIIDPDNAYRYLQVRGVVAEVTTEGAETHIDRMAFKYLGEDRHPFRKPGVRRVIFKIRPIKVQSSVINRPPAEPVPASGASNP